MPSCEQSGVHCSTASTGAGPSANDRVAQDTKRAYGEQVSCYGVKPAQVHHIGLDLVRQMRTGGLALALEVADPLWRSGSLEEGLIGAQVVNAVGRHVSGREFERFEAWASTITNTATADALATHLVSRALAAKPSLVDKLRDWTKSPVAVRRRAAVMAFVPLVREGRFITDTLSVLEQVMTDPDTLVQEGAGQVLMEASRLRADRVLEFLRLWKQRSSRVLLARATSKLTPAQRAEVLGG